MTGTDGARMAVPPRGIETPVHPQLILKAGLNFGVHPSGTTYPDRNTGKGSYYWKAQTPPTESSVVVKHN